MERITHIADHIARSPEATDAQFRLLVSSVTDYAIYLLDATGCVASWNAGAERIKGYRADEVTGRHFSLFYTAEDRAAALPARVLAQAEREGRFEGEGWRVRKDGSRFWADVVVTALRDERGALKGFAKVTRDTTVRHAAEEKLRESERRFRLLVEGVSDYAIYLLDADGRISSWNGGAQRIKGYAADEVLGRHYSMFFPAEDRAAGKPQRALEIARNTGRFHDEGWRLRKDGSRFWALAVVDAIRDQTGTLVGFAKITRDISDWRIAEQRLRESEARLQAFTDNSPAAMALKDRDGRYVFVNAHFLERHGLARGQVLGRTDGEVFPRRQAAAASARDTEVLSQGAAVQYEESLQVGGAERIALVTKFPVGEGIGVVATDITDRRLTEQALREQRRLLVEAQKIAGLGSWEWDPQSGGLSWSDELYRIYGLSPDAFKPSFEAYLERVHPDDRQQSGAMLARALMDGRGFTMQERIVRPGGELRYLRSHGEVVRSDRGRPLKILGASLDVTEQRHSESALRQAAQDLQTLTRRLVRAEEDERRRIARELHDSVGQSLSALNINLDIVAKGAQALPTALQRRLEDSSALVDATLQSIESVMAELRPPLLDEYGLGAAFGWHIEEFTRRTGIRAILSDAAGEAAKRLPPEVAVALFRIGQEALNNVAKHARAKNVEIRLDAAADTFMLEILDDGEGFDPARAPRDRWGMTTMRERAEAAGGSIAVESAPGRGARVTVRIPL